MKFNLSVVLGIVCVVLVVALFVIKQGDNTQHTADTASINDFSNDLSSARSQIAANIGTILTLSNNLAQCQSGSLTLSNQLTDAKSADDQQITNLNSKVTEMQSENLALNQHVTELTNQTAALTTQLAATKTSLDMTNQALSQANNDYLLLENRFRINVAERVVTERKFHNLQALEEQVQSLKEFPYDGITAEKIYAGLDVGVRSNGTFHVITPN